jgi:hypothetical protein
MIAEFLDADFEVLGDTVREGGLRAMPVLLGMKSSTTTFLAKHLFSFVVV